MRLIDINISHEPMPIYMSMDNSFKRILTVTWAEDDFTSLSSVEFKETIRDQQLINWYMDFLLLYKLENGFY